MILNYKEFKAYLDTLTYRPKLMLHSCCAPCSSHVLFLLKDYFEITIFYSNDNIYPYEEYERRLKEEIRFCKEIDSTLQVIFDPYNEDDFNTIISGMEHLGEKTKRCYACYKLRLEKTARKAKELGYEYFTDRKSVV